MHHNGGIGGLDHRGTDDAVARHEKSAVVDRASRGSFQISPVDIPLAQARFGADLGTESPGRRKLGTRRCCGRAQAQRDDFQSRLTVG